MELDQNDIPSSEGTEMEPILNNFNEIDEPTITNTESDCRINATDCQSLRNILDVVHNHIEELLDTFNLTDKRTEFQTAFIESFKNALQENILVNGLPFTIDENKKLSASQRNEHLHMVDDVLYGKLSKRVSIVAQDRKFFPEQFSRILNIFMKHEIQNLKRTKVTEPNLQSSSFKYYKSYNKDRTYRKEFSDFCQRFGTMQETVQCKLQELEKLAMKLSVVKEIQKNQKGFSKLNKEKVRPTSIFMDGLNADIQKEDLEREFRNDQDTKHAIRGVNGAMINGSQIHVDLPHNEDGGGRHSDGNGYVKEVDLD